MPICCPMGITMKIEIQFVPVDSQARIDRIALLQTLLLQGARRLSEPMIPSIPPSESASSSHSAEPSEVESFHV